MQNTRACVKLKVKNEDGRLEERLRRVERLWREGCSVGAPSERGERHFLCCSFMPRGVRPETLGSGHRPDATGDRRDIASTFAKAMVDKRGGVPCSAIYGRRNLRSRFPKAIQGDSSSFSPIQGVLEKKDCLFLWLTRMDTNLRKENSQMAAQNHEQPGHKGFSGLCSFASLLLSQPDQPSTQIKRRVSSPMPKSRTKQTKKCIPPLI